MRGATHEGWHYARARLRYGHPPARSGHAVQTWPAPGTGWLSRLDALAVGTAAWRLGAGRARKEDDVSAAAGLICLAKPGDRVEAGQPLLELRADDPGRFAAALDTLAGAAEVADQPPAPVSAVIEVVAPV